MECYLKKLCKVWTQEHKQNAIILNMINTLKEDIQEVETEAVPHTDMASTLQYKKNIQDII